MKNFKGICMRCQKSVTAEIFSLKSRSTTWHTRWIVLVRSSIVSDHGVFNLFMTKGHKSLSSLWFSAVTQMLYSAQEFCCEKCKTPQKCTVSEAEMSRVWSCSHHGGGQQLQHKPRSGPLHREPQKWLSHFPGEDISSSDSAWLKQAKRACALPWFCISLSHSSQWADVKKLFSFWNIAASRSDRKYCTTPENCPNTSKCYILLPLNLLV